MNQGGGRLSRFPHPLALLVGCVLVAALLTWVLPAGKYQRREDPATGRSVVIAGTYARVPQQPIGLMGTATAIPKGIVDAAPVIALILLIGGGFTVVESNGPARSCGWSMVWFAASGDAAFW